MLVTTMSKSFAAQKYDFLKDEIIRSATDETLILFMDVCLITRLRPFKGLKN